VKFDLNIYGTEKKAKLQVQAEYDKQIQQYKLSRIDLKTLTDSVNIIWTVH